MSRRPESPLVELLHTSGGVFVWSGLTVLANGVSGVLSARALSVADKGLLVLVLTIGGLLWVATSLGTSVAFRISYLRLSATITMRDYAALTLRLTCVQTILTLVLLVVAGNWIPELQLSLPMVLLVLAVSASVFVSSQILDALHAIERSAAATGTDAAGAVATALLITLGSTAGVITGHLSIVIVCYLAGYFCRAAVGLRRLLVLNPRQRAGTTSSGRRQLIRTGLPFLGFNIGQVVAFRADRYLLGMLAGPAATGLYSVAATPAELLRLPVTSLSQIMMQRTAAEGPSRRAVVRACVLAALITIPPAGAVFLFAGHLVVWLFGPRYEAATGVLQVLVLSELFVALFLLLSRVAAGAGIARSTGVATGVGAIVGIGSLCALAPRYGEVGAAWASLCGYAVMAGALVVPVFRRARAHATQALAAGHSGTEARVADSHLTVTDT
jgi:O-antigen/teichoic acid export membrane protein